MTDLFMERYEAARDRRLENPNSTTHDPRFLIGDLMSAIWSIDSEDDARQFFAGHVADIQRQINEGAWDSRYTAEEGARANIGWMYGEGMDPERIAMWRRSTGSEHPIGLML